MLQQIVLTFLVVPFLVRGTPYTCTEVSTTYSQTVFPDSSFIQHSTGKFVEIISDSNFTYSAKYNLFQDSKNVSYIKLYDVKGFDTTYSSSIHSLCYWFVNCHSNFSSPANIKLLTTDPFVRFDINFGTNETFFMDGFFADQGTISHWDGTIFSPSNSCVYDLYKDSSLIKNRTTCCTKFSPGHETSISYPKCKKFKSRTIVHNLDFSIFGTSSVNYTLNGNKVAMMGDWDGQTTFGFELATKFFMSSDPKKKFAINSTLPSGDVKMYFTSIFQVNGLPIAVQDVIAFIIDGKNTLMKDTMPYTKQNDCSYHSFSTIRGGIPLPTTVEMCCKEFES